MNIIIRIITHLFLFLFVFIIPSLWIIQSPQYNQKITTQFLKEKVEIFREQNGFAHIFSETYEGSLFGLGYTHCQDRLFQMILKRLIIQGRMSEFFGEELLELDIYFRKLGIYEISISNYNHLQKNEQNILDVYSQGVNECVKNRNSLPWEMKLINLQFENWTGQDSMSFIKLTSIFLAFDYKYEIIREKIAEKIGEENASLLLGGLLEENQFHIDDTVIFKEEIEQMKQYQQIDIRKIVKRINREQFNQNQQDLDQNKEQDKEQDKKDKKQDKKQDIKDRKDLNLIQQSMYDLIDQMTIGVKGSNNWVISGNLTKNGGVLMASDPHLDNGIPTVWHLSEINYKQNNEEKYIIGVNMAGMPFYAIGRNNKLCFSVTVLFNDNTDMYLENINDKDQYRFENEWVDVIKQQQVIKIKNKDDFVMESRWTRKGPIIDTIIGGKDKIFNKIKENVSLAWSGFNSKFHRFDQLIRLAQQEDVESYMKSAATQRDMFLNVLLGDIHNNIAYYPMGANPIKLFKDAGFFKDATKQHLEWKGYISYENQTKLLNPKRGWIATANNKNMPDNSINSHTYGIGSTARAKRIHFLIQEQLKQNKTFTIQDMIDFQLDIKDSYWQTQIFMWINLVQHVVLTMKQKQYEWLDDQKLKIIYNLLESLTYWDSQMKKESYLAAIVQLWEMYFSYQLTQFIEQEYNYMAMGSHFFKQFLFNYIQHSCINYGQQHKYTWAHQICENQNCLFQFVQTLYQSYQYMEDNNFSNYGQIHNMIYPHQFAQKIPILKNIFGRQFEASGNSRTISAALPHLEKFTTEGYHSSNLRIIFDLKGDSLYTLDIGQSENYFSEHYDDMSKIYQQGQYYKLNFGQQFKNTYPYKITIN